MVISRRTSVACLFPCVASLLCGAMVRADVSENFDSAAAGLEGWGHVGDPGSTIVYVASGGNPGGFAQVRDAAQGLDDYFVAPSAFLGAKPEEVGGTLSFDILPQFTVIGNDGDVIISNGTTSLYYVYPKTIIASVWQHVSMTLSTSDTNWHVGAYTGSAPVMSDFQNVLSNITSLKILGDFTDGAENNDIDNVLLHTTAIPGDANLDGVVNIADLNILAANWQKSVGGWSQADFNGDGVVNITDLNTLASHWQDGAGGGASFGEALSAEPGLAGVVPEPGTVGVLAVGVVALWGRRRR